MEHQARWPTVRNEGGIEMRMTTCPVVIFLCVQSMVGLAEDCPSAIGGLPDGPATSVVVEGQYAYFGSGATVQILDVSDPAAPQTIGRVEVETEVLKLDVEDGVVYASSWSQGLTIIDASDASAPVVASRITVPEGTYGFFYDVDAIGQFAFVAAGSGELKVLDVNDPTHPMEIDVIDVPGNPFAVAASPSHAYVAWRYGLTIVDVSDPAAGFVVAELPLPRWAARTVVVSGSTVYVAGEGGFHAIDVSDPASPAVIGSLPFSASSQRAGNLDVRADLAYFPDGYLGVRVIGVSDPTTPVQVALIEPPSSSRGVAAMEAHVLVAAGTAGLRSYDVTIPTEPVEISVLKTPAKVVDIAVDGSRGVSVASGGLRVFDLADPSKPVEIGSFDLVEPWGPRCVDLSGGHAFVCDVMNDRVVVFDVEDANEVSQVAEIDAREADDIEVVPPYAYIAANDLLIVDVSDPADPTLVATHDHGAGWRGSLAVEFPYLYLTQWAEEIWAGLSILDVSDPARPATIGTAFHRDLECCGSMAVSESWVYVIDNTTEGAYTLHTVDARDPADPIVVDSVYLGSMSDIAASGSSGMLGVVEGNNYEVLELDLTNPEELTVVGRTDTPARPSAIAVADGRWFVAELEGGFEVFELCKTGLQDAAWLEIAAHVSGAKGSEWRTDVVARNRGVFEATFELSLYADGVEHELTNTVDAGAQAVFEDVVGMMGVEGKGALEVRSSQPLSVIGRIYTEDDEGTLGQFLLGQASQDGLSEGEAAWLHGMRQLGQLYRSNLSITNTGMDTASVRVTLFGSDGVAISEFDLESIEPREVVQEIAPFVDRAGRPDIGWAMTRVEVLSGRGVLASASVIDSRTNDPTTIPMVRE